MNNSSHRPAHRAGHHSRRPASTPRRWTSVLLALLVLVAALSVSAPAAVAELSAQDTTTITSDAGAEGADLEADSSDPADPETTAPEDEELSAPGNETTEPREPTADTLEEPTDPTDGESTEGPEPIEPSGKSSQSTPKMAISPMLAAGAPNTVEAGGTTYSAYVGPGESLTTNFTKFRNVVAGGSNTRFRITDPSGTVRNSCTILGTQAVGITCAVTDLTGPAGVWTIEVTALTNNPANWPESGASHFNWSISVQNAAGTDIPGRVWTEKYRGFDTSSAASYPLDFWVATEHGSQYKVDLNGFIGGGWAFDSTAYGLTRAGTCTPRYQSMDAITNSPEYPPAPASCGDPYKLFFEPPAADLPATATTPTGTDWINPPLSTPSVDNLEFAQAGGATRAGDFAYDLIEFTGAYRLQIDANNDGDYADPVDRDIPLGGSSGPQSYTWDGLDGDGDPIDSCQAINTRVQIDQTDEVHFVLGDTEQLGGMTIEQLVGNAPGASRLYWDDRGVTGSPATPVVDGRAGVESDTPAGVHGWGRATAPAISWGDLSIIDSWTYSQVDISDTIALGVCALDLGDAPQSYGTLLAGSGPTGPSHVVADGIHLGASIDVESDGQPGPAADGDGADEEGVVFNPALSYPNPTIRTGVDPDSQQPISNTLEVEASAVGFVSVWVDLNMDGDFTDADERVAHATSVTAGSNDISFGHAQNPPGIQTYVRVRYSTDAVWVEDPTGPALDGEVEDYRVLVERLVQPDTCVPTDMDYYAFTFGQPAPADLTGNGAVGSSARYRNVTVVDGVAVDLVADVVAGSNSISQFPPNGFLVGGDDAAWSVLRDSTIRYRFFEAGTTTPIAISGVFTVSDMDGGTGETAIWSAGDLASYDVDQDSAVTIVESGGNIEFHGNSNWNGDPQSRFQVVLEGLDSVEVQWLGGSNSGFAFDGDKDLSINPACDDFGDAPNSFGTDLASNGPRHTLRAGLTIGSQIDFDPNGLPTADATGDDIDRIADEDAFPGGLVLNPGVTNPTLTVPVTNSLGVPATLSGWMDSNNNGRFEASEHVSVTVPVGATSVALAFSGLPPLQDGTSPMVRLRLTTGTLTDNAGTPNVDERALGAAPDGEVEDHLAQVATLVPISCAEPFIETFGTGPGYGPALPTGQTTYTYVGAPEPDNMIDDGDYAIVTSPREAHTGWVIGADHTAGDTNGRMMLVNASFDEGTFFQRTFTGLAVGVEYDFSAYLTSVLSGSGISPNVTFQIVDPTTGTVLSSVDSGAIPNTGAVQWDRYNMAFTAPQSTVRLELLNNAPGGGGNDLAIDDISFSPVCEFGDAPQSYGTLVGDDGPGHIATGPTLGTERDTESDGQPSPGADGDDTTGTPDDEDGVANPIEMSVGAEASVTVSATNDSDEDVTLAGWIDLDGDGTFQDSERVTVTVPANSGTAAYQLDFPAGTTTTDTYARFRIYGVLMTDPQPTGTVAAGEVEDYRVTVLEPQLVIDKSSNATADARPGDEITYTVTATNAGPGDYTAANPARVWDDLSGVLDDATYNGNATSDRTPPDPVYADPILSWTGDLPTGETVTITYTVTLKGGGDGRVRNVAFGQCDPADPDCDTTTPECDPPVGGTDPDTRKVCDEEEFELPKLTIAKASNRTDLPAVGQRVIYTVTVTNEGPGDYTAAEPGTINDDLSAVLDDASIDTSTINADVGTATFNDPYLEWTGVLAEGESATITYEVVYNAGGDHSLVNNACVPVTEAQDPQDACATVTIPGSGLDQDKVADPTSGSAVEVGEEITYTLRLANTGQTAAAVDTFDDLSAVLDDADFVVGSLNAEAGLSATYDAAGERIDLTGIVPVGGTLEVTYKVRVRPWAGQGDHILENALQCQAGDAPDCEPDVTEHRVRALDIEKTSDRTADTEIGDTVTYTVTGTNIGEADYTAADPARVWDDLTGVLDDATYDGDAETVPAGVGTITYGQPIISWVGELAKGDTVTLTYTVTVTGAGDLNVRNVAFVACDPADSDCDNTTPVCDPPTAEGIDPVSGKRCAEEEFGVPDIRDAKTVDPADHTAVAAGDELTYALTFTNDGTAAGAVFKDDSLAMLLDDAELMTPPGITVAGSGAAGVTATLNGQRIQVRGTLGAKETVTVTYTVKVKPDAQRVADGGDDMLGNFLIDPNGPPPPTACEPEADEDSTCNPVARIVDEKSVTPADRSTVGASDELTYMLRFENLGQGTGAVDDDDYLGMMLDDAVIVSGPTVAGQGNLTATRNGDRFEIRGTLGAGDVATVTYTVRVKTDAGRQADGGDDMLGNFLIDPNGPPPPTQCEPEADEDSTCNPVSRIVDSKSVTPADRTAVEAGEELTFTLRFENLGQGAGPVSKDDSLGMLLDDAEIVTGPIVVGKGNLTATLVGDRIEIRGTLGAGDLATVTYTVRVKTDADRQADGGDNMLANFLIGPDAPPPTRCEPVDEDSTCNPVRELDIEKSSDRTVDTKIGDPVTYTVTARNTGNGDYTAATPAVVRDDLAGVLDDAMYDNNAAADKPGNLSYTAPIIEWTGALAIDEVVTITYTVKLKAGGDLDVRNVAWGGGGSTPKCDPPTAEGHDTDTGKPCDEEQFGLPDIVDEKQVDPTKGSTVSSGQLLNYTLTFTNKGTAPGKVARVDDLSQVLDDATVVAPPVSSDPALTVSPISHGKLTTTGELAPGQTVTVTYRVQVKKPENMGDKLLGNYLLEPGQVPPTPEECLAQMGEDSTCNPVSNIVAEKSVDPKDGSKVKGGDELTYTLGFTNTGEGAGQVDYVDKLAGILDDTTLIEGPMSSEAAITASLKDGKVRIEGTLAGGQSATVAYTVRVKAYGDQGDHVLANFLAPRGASPSGCAAGDPLCTENASAGTGGEGRGDHGDDGGLPDTGGPALAALLAGMALLLGGALFLTVARRRRGES